MSSSEEKQNRKMLVRLASFPERNTNPIIEVNATGEVTYLNPTAAKLFPEIKFSQSDTVTRQHPMLAGLESFWVSLQDKNEKTAYREIKTGDTVYEQHLSYVPESNTLRIYAFDITERKLVEEKLRRSARALESAMEAVMITDTEGIIVSVNAAFSKITGYSAEEIIGKNRQMLFTRRHVEETGDSIRISLKNTSQWQGGIWNRRKNGEEYPGFMFVSATLDENGRLMEYVYIFDDLSERGQEKSYAGRLVFYDSLTSLPNRFLFKDRLSSELAHGKHQPHLMAVMFLDIDRFRNINETLGDLIGDQILKIVSSRLKACVREGDTVARMGGDEFALQLPHLTSSDEAVRVAQKIIDTFKTTFLVEGHELFLTPSIGIGIFPNDGDRPETLMKNADIAMHRAKEKGGNSYRLFTSSMNARILEKMMLENKLRKALKRNEFELHYQPQFDLDSGRIIGMEALIRWRQPELGLVSPGEFIPLAEETGLIIPIGEWVIRTACARNKAWQDDGFGPIRVAVNLAASQFQQENIGEIITRILEKKGLDSRFFEVEITESAIMQNVESAISTMNILKDRGIQISIDDFGTGYSSLSYLKKFPIQTLKIDRSFISEITTDSDDKAIVTAIIAMAKSLKLKVIAEGVETVEQLDLLRCLKCDEVQGFLFSKPLPPEEFTKLLSISRK